MIQLKLIGTLRAAFICALLAVGMLVTSAQAAEHLAWNQVAFASAQNAGKSNQVPKPPSAANRPLLLLDLGLPDDGPSRWPGWL